MLLLNQLPSNVLCPPNKEPADAYEVYIHRIQKSEN